MLLAVGAAWGQMINIATPMTRTSDSFFERNGVNFGFNLPGNNSTPFTQGSFNSAIPPTGNYDPSSVATGGFGILGGGGGGGFFNFAAGQGSDRSIISETPSVTVTNGYPGSISDTSQRPFVTGLIPVVGGGYMPTFGISTPAYPVMQPSARSPLYDRLQAYNQRVQSGLATPLGSATAAHRPLSREERAALHVSAAPASTASHGDLSVAEIKRQRESRVAAEAAEQADEIAALVERARGAEAEGKSGVAKIYYRQAAARAEGDLRQQILQKLRDLQ